MIEMGSMFIPEMIGAIVLIIAGIVIVFLIASQDPKTDGISSLAGVGSFLGSGGKDRSIDAKINRFIKYLCAGFFVVVVVVYALNLYL